MMKKLNRGSMKSLVVTLGVIILTAISCTKSDESLQSNQSENESTIRAIYRPLIMEDNQSDELLT